MAQIAALGVGLVALGVDARVPVAVRGSAGLRRDLAAERVAAFGLVEVAVDGQSGTDHRFDGSGGGAERQTPDVGGSNGEARPGIEGLGPTPPRPP